MKNILSALGLMILLSNSAIGQKLHKCDSSLSYWVIGHGNQSMKVRLSGEVKSSKHPKFLLVNDLALQYLIVEKEQFIKKNEDNTDLAVLVRYALYEANYLSSQFRKKINIQMQKTPLSSDTEVLIWYYKMPEEFTDQVDNQVYVNIVHNDLIIGFSTPQLHEQDLKDIKDFLMDVISTLESIQADENPCAE